MVLFHEIGNNPRSDDNAPHAILALGIRTRSSHVSLRRSVYLHNSFDDYIKSSMIPTMDRTDRTVHQHSRYIHYFSCKTPIERTCNMYGNVLSTFTLLALGSLFGTSVANIRWKVTAYEDIGCDDFLGTSSSPDPSGCVNFHHSVPVRS